MKAESLTAIVVALQFAAFGWRINREISVGDQNRRIWLPISDYINLIALVSTIIMCVIIPLANGNYEALSKAILASAAVLIGFHPFNVAAHYCLLTGRGRAHYIESKGDYPYATGEEIITIIITLIISSWAGWYVYSHIVCS